MDHKQVFADAAKAAREIREGKLKQRERAAKALATIDEEIAKLDAVISLDESEGAIAQATEPGPAHEKVKQGEWPKRIVEALTAKRYTVTELLEYMRTAHNFPHRMPYLQKLLASGEKAGRIWCDEERRWGIKMGSNGAPRGKAAPWFQGVPQH